MNTISFIKNDGKQKMKETPKILKVEQWKAIQEFFYKGELTSEIIENAYNYTDMIAGKKPYSAENIDKVLKHSNIIINKARLKEELK